MAEAREEILFVEYLDGKIHSVVTTKATYDVCWCERDGCHYFHDSGGGNGPFPVQAGMTYWLREGHEVCVPRGKGGPPWYRKPRKGDDLGTRLAEPIAEYSLDYIGRELGDSDVRCVYCPSCRDMIPDLDYAEMCDHVWWCDATGWYSSPGERCRDDCEDCLRNARATRADEYPTGFIGKGHGEVADDHISEHHDYWDGRSAGFFFAEDWPWIAVGSGVGLGAMRWFDEREAANA